MRVPGAPSGLLHAAALAAGFAFAACGIDLSDSLEGRACKGAEGSCLAGYECVDQVCVRKDGRDASATGQGGTSNTADAGSGGGASTDGGAPSETGGAPASGGTRESNGGAPGAGGASSGGRGSGGASAGGADAGTPSGDGSTGGAASAGGDAGIADARPEADAPAPDAGSPTDGVRCHGTQCGSGELCCLADYPGFPAVPDPADFSCETSTASCAYALRCDGNEDCDSDEVCCATQSNGRWTAACASNCNNGNNPVAWACTSPAQCPAGTLCCGTWSNGSGRIAKTQCQAACTGTNARLFCDARTVCPGTTTCQDSSTAPGFEVCL